MGRSHCRGIEAQVRHRFVERAEGFPTTSTMIQRLTAGAPGAASDREAPMPLAGRSGWHSTAWWAKLR